MVITKVILERNWIIVNNVGVIILNLFQLTDYSIPIVVEINLIRQSLN